MAMEKRASRERAGPLRYPGEGEQPQSAMDVAGPVPHPDGRIAQPAGGMDRDQAGRGREEIGQLIHEQPAERRNEERRKLNGPTAVLPGPAGEAQRDPARPQLLFGGHEQRHGIAFDVDALAETGCFEGRRLGSEEPHRNVGHFAAEVSTARSQFPGETPKTAATFCSPLPANASQAFTRSTSTLRKRPAARWRRYGRPA